VSKEKQNKKKFSEDSHGIMLTEEQVQKVPFYVVFCYNCNPYTILSCAGHTTTVFNNFCVALSLLSMSKGIPCNSAVFSKSIIQLF
jgi:GPI transamidase subunit PIG-U